ncbi:hypothetical protein BJ973_001567 [Actinoplanes tereljensis]|uniref:DUF2255 family protein n=1 Tax=Paractinoplanes tereljensis TaxID=571912 RepID=A0A919TU02_9ACTN|nr:DUF2255 family protein [Actinoplanes tereljensis]GIF20527.1 hypothetical protein Ate02nite_32570 [Actinoplanes tereljensis]
MSWTDEELAAIGDATELRIASRRANGTLRQYVTIWVVRSGDELYVRSAYGSGNPWFRRAVAAGTGRIQAGGVERDVTFTLADPATGADLDRAYHTKYDSYGPAIVGTVVGEKAAPVTIRLEASA